MRLAQLIRLAARLLVANRARFIVLISGSVAVALAASSLSLAGIVSQATVKQTVASGWRGAYDILVRPQDAATLTVGDLHLVPANYLGARTSGITRDAWQKILAIPGVEVAAPVAALGWMKQDDVNIGLQLPKPNPDQILRIDVRIQTGAGPAAVQTAYLAIDSTGSAPTVFVGGSGFAIGDREIEASVATLPSGWGLVVGVDPDQEERLIGLEQFVDGSYLSTGTSLVEDPAYGGTAVAVPVLTASTLPLSGSVEVSVQVITGIDPQAVARAVAEQSAPTSEHKAAGLAEILALVGTMTSGGVSREVLSGTQLLSKLVEPLRAHAVSVDSEGRIATTDVGGGGFSAYGRNAVLVPQVAPYRVIGGQELVLDPSGTWAKDITPRIRAIQPKTFSLSDGSLGTDPTVYRPVRVEQPQLFRVQAIGTYDLSAISAAFGGTTNYVPLGIYADTPRRLVATADGAPVDEILPASLNPAGANPLPPAGITNLEAVEALRGARFIDAIRVRVAGIGGYSPEALGRIESVATAIEQRTGLHVDVVAGSSLVDVRVQMAGLGTVLERWTTLGEAVQIESAVVGFSGVLLWAAGLVVVLYLITFGSFLVGDQQAELSVLRLVGWRRRTTTLLLVAQAGVLGLGSGMLAAVITALVGWAMAVTVAPPFLLAIAVAVMGSHLVAAAAVSLLVQRGKASSQLRGSSVDWAPKLGRGMLRLVIAQAGESHLRFVAVTLGLSLALAVAGVVIGVELALGSRLNLSVLGQLVAVRVGPYHLLGAAAALLAAGAMAVDAGVLGVERRLSLIGLLRAVGWRTGEVRRIVAGEMLLAGAIAGVMAGAVIAIVLAAAGSPWLLVIGIALGALLGAFVTAVVATLPATNLATQVRPALTLSAEGAPGGVPGFTGRSALVSVGSFSAVAVAGALVWGLISPQPIPPGAANPTPSPRPLGEIAQRVEADVRAIAANADRQPGSAALRSAQAYVRQQLEVAGYAVQEVPFFLPSMDLLNAAGQPTDTSALSVFPIAIAYDPALLSGPALIAAKRVAFVDLMAGEPSRSCPAGVAILRVGRVITDISQASAASELMDQCMGKTQAALAITAPDAEWARLPQSFANIRLRREHDLVATPPGALEDAAVPWIIAPLGSTASGATQSAAPTAVALELARLAAKERSGIRLAFVADSSGSDSSLLRRIASDSPQGRVLLLGPMGGPLATRLGTTAFPPEAELSSAALQVELLSSVAADAGLHAWLTASQAPQRSATSTSWLQALAATGLQPSAAARTNLFALAAGLDAAVVGEAPVITSDIQSIAGSQADLPDQVDVRRLAGLAQGLAAALRLGGA